jgi:hypothetical protein
LKKNGKNININMPNIIITTNNFESLIENKKINYEDLKTKLTINHLENIYFKAIIINNFGYNKYKELYNFFTNNKNI